jgi:hypothetical protein
MLRRSNFDLQVRYRNVNKNGAVHQLAVSGGLPPADVPWRWPNLCNKSAR